ncbi:hypothetical protein GUJ93_ZPchr0012g21441 [Zizania palustris]|uniref:Uncharacterized protein n=1 Tax=Zizania palustris TaxID=103762 RepID=A0A8J5WVH9_ZIZPA|nr:hypothetical protein GUJ93_ZPchr0012g21441 [Zizania palustris]
MDGSEVEKMPWLVVTNYAPTIEVGVVRQQQTRAQMMSSRKKMKAKDLKHVDGGSTLNRVTYKASARQFDS